MSSASVARILCSSLERQTNNKCLVFETRTWTRGQVLRAALNFAAYLRETVTEGEVVLFVADNSDVHAVAMLGVVFAGAVYASAPGHSTAREVRELVRAIGPQLVVTELETGVQVDTSFHAISVRAVQQVFEMHAPTDTVADGAPDDVVTLVLSSGSSGQPKAIKRSNRNIVATLSMFTHEEMQPFTEEDVVLSTGFCHICGQRLVFSAIASGAQVAVVRSDENHEDVFEAIDRFGVTATVLIPTQLNWLVQNNYPKEKIASLQDVMTGAAPLSPQTHRSVEEMFGFRKFRNSYGMSESGFALMVPLGARIPSRETVGRVVPGFEVKVVDANDNALEANHVGEILLRGDQVTAGYWRDERAHLFTDDGFLRSGDLGFFDEQRFFFVVSRLKEIIKCDGVSVAPAELEHVLLQHKEVESAAVIGVEDEQRGQVPMAFVTLTEGATASEEALQEWADARLNDFKKVRGGVKVVAQMPRTHSGKVRKSLLFSEI